MIWYSPSRPAAIKPVPWLAPAAIAKLSEIIRPEDRVLEYGSGGSTIWFSQKAAQVVAYESNRDWKNAVEARGLQNVTFRFPCYLPEEPPRSFDLILIDGDPVQMRAAWLDAATEIIRPGGWIVLDNSNRPEYARERARLQAVCESAETIDGNINGTWYLVTDFYKMP